MQRQLRTKTSAQRRTDITMSEDFIARHRKIADGVLRRGCGAVGEVRDLSPVPVLHRACAPYAGTFKNKENPPVTKPVRVLGGV